MLRGTLTARASGRDTGMADLKKGNVWDGRRQPEGGRVCRLNRLQHRRYQGYQAARAIGCFSAWARSYCEARAAGIFLFEEGVSSVKGVKAAFRAEI